MPDPDQPGRLLRGGEFYSPIEARLDMGAAFLSELRQPGSRSMPRHEHALGYVTVVLQGNYLEGDHGRLDELAPLTAVFNPVGVTHSTTIGPAGASLFTIEFRREALHALDLQLPEEITVDRGNGALLWPGLRLYSAFKGQTADSCMPEGGILQAEILEAQVLEMLAAITGFHRPEKSVPRWFSRVKERLHDSFRDRFRMCDLAHEAGVHPVHLARVFRQIERCTPGEYQQRLQVRAACELLRDVEWPLAAIAAECGFADQSHFTRVFRRFSGTTPARFRMTVVPRSRIHAVSARAQAS
jgi:AraC family transcriptional regulator